MAFAITELPPEGKISMIGIWIETLLYGVNLVTYGLCMYSLFRRGKPTRLVLKVTCTVIFLLCTVHVAASLRQLLDAFVYAPSDIPDYSTVYWLHYSTPLRLLKDFIYNTLVLVQNFILVWRLYVVFMGDKRVIVIPIIFAVGSVGCVYASSVLPYGSVTTPLVIASWVCGFILNALVSGGIVARLWWMGRRMASLATTLTYTNRFASSMYVAIESGAITVACGTVAFALVVSQSAVAFASLDVVVQLVALNPLLIVIQADRTNPYRIQSGELSPKTLAMDEMTFRVVVPQEQESWQDSSLYSRSHSPSSLPDVRV